MDKFILDFKIRPLEQHYKQELERMRREKIPLAKANSETLTLRAFKVDQIFKAVGTLEFFVYVSAVVSPFPKDAPIISQLICKD